MTELADLEALIGRLATIDFSQTSEQATREMAVNPVIGALGWDTFSPGEVAREHPVRGGKVDYCLRGPRGPLVLIEVKRTGTELSEHQEQLLGYAFREGVPLAALTDGLIWWLYLPTAEGSWEQRRFYRIDCREQDAARAASALNRFLSREGLVGGTALDEARREFESQERGRRVRATLQDAWRQVLCDPESLLPELLAEKVKEISGYLPDRETVAEFLQGVPGTGSTEHESPPPPPRGRGYRASEQHKPGQFVPTSTKRKKSTIRMTTRVEDSQLLVQFADGAREQWGLPDRSDNAAIRRVRDAAVAFAHGQGATLGQVNAVKKALTDAGYYLTGPRDGDSSRSRPEAATSEREDFTGRCPRAFWLHENRYEATQWSEVLRGVCDQLAKEAGAAFDDRVLSLRDSKGHLYFSEEPDRLRRPMQLEHSRLYVSEFSRADRCVRLARRVLVAVRGSEDGFRVEVADEN